jgi:drug/metabolite transporter (DMT)-like permease
LTLPALIALAGSFCFALLMVVTRVVRDTNDTVPMVTQYLGTLAFGAVTAPFAWVTPTVHDLAFLSGFGVVSIIALFCVNRSLKLAPASVVVPYQYTMLLWAVLLGWRMFGEVPDRFTIAGGAIIVTAGLYIFWREQAAARTRAREQAA